jgi:nucleotide-binding universal stress UspA family protein
MMYQRILVPIDGSRTAKVGLAHALSLAKDQDATVRVLNVVDDITVSPPMEPYAAGEVAKIVEASRREGQKALKAAAALAQRARVAAETAQIEACGGRVSDVILHDAGKWKPDLIVMGTHGRRGLKRLLLGSDAERVLREAPVPVLLARASAARPRKVPR